jgi:uncharacterized membrane protein (DUF2068 family)
LSSVAHKALRPIAVFEAFKGALVLVAGLGLLGFLSRDNGAYAEQIIRQLHLDPARHYAKLFIMTMAEESDSQIMAFATFAAFYATVRFVEAYGLWHERRWAEWLAALSGGVYVPIEIYELVSRASWIKCGALLINIAVVAYMAWLLTENRRRKTAEEKNRAQSV